MGQLIPDEEYKTCLKNLPIYTVDLVLLSKDLRRVLLFRRENAPLKSVYFTPGGRVCKGEKVEEAIVRKAEEELGLSVQYEDLIFGGFADEIFEDSIYDGVKAHCFNLFWGYVLKEADLESGVLRLDEQHTDGKWFEVGDVDLHPYVLKKVGMVLEAFREK